MSKSFSYIIFGILVLAIVPNSVMQSYAQPTLFGVTAGAGSPSDLYSIDPNTGAAILIGSIGFKSCSGIAIHPNTGDMFGACNISTGQPGSKVSVLVSINTLTGAGTLIGQTGIEIAPIFALDISDLSFRSNGQLFGFAPNGDVLVTIDTSTGAATLIGPTGIFFGDGNAIAWSPGDILFYADGIDLNTLNPVTGAETFVATLNYPIGVLRISGMDFQPVTNILYGSTGGGGFGPGGSNLVTIDTNLGVVTIVGNTGLDGLTGLAFPISILVGGTLIPIDTTALLLASVQSIWMWMIPVVVAGIAIGIFVIKRRK